MSFKQIHNEGVVARIVGKSVRDNPYYQSENLPTSESPAAYRAWQMRAEAWELGWSEQEQLLNPPLQRPLLRDPAAWQTSQPQPQSIAPKPIALMPRSLLRVPGPTVAQPIDTASPAFFQHNEPAADRAVRC